MVFAVFLTCAVSKVGCSRYFLIPMFVLLAVLMGSFVQQFYDKSIILVVLVCLWCFITYSVTLLSMALTSFLWPSCLLSWLIKAFPKISENISQLGSSFPKGVGKCWKTK